jgi:hypothetical protein
MINSAAFCGLCLILSGKQVHKLQRSGGKSSVMQPARKTTIDLHLAMKYWPTRVDEKSKKAPSDTSSGMKIYYSLPKKYLKKKCIVWPYDAFDISIINMNFHSLSS